MVIFHVAHSKILNADGRILVVGGGSQDSPSNAIQELDISKGIWSELPYHFSNSYTSHVALVAEERHLPPTCWKGLVTLGQKGHTFELFPMSFKK